jgi:phosphatidylglycerophosphate synthase
MSLNKLELDNLKKWEYKVTDKSITTEYYKKYWILIESYISPKISPNLITFTGFFLLFTNYILTSSFLDYYPTLISIYVAISTQIYCHLDALDGIHARNTKTSSPLGELVDHICDTIGLIFIILSMCNILKIDDINVMTYTTLTGMIGFQFFHIQAYLYKGVEFGRYTGPTELLSLYSIVILLKVFNLFDNNNLYMINIIAPYVLLGFFFGNLYYMYTRLKYYLVNILIFTALYTIIGFSVLFNQNYNTYYLFNICLNLCALTCDFIISKMANKNLNMFLIKLFLLSRFNDILGIGLSMFYIVASLKEIANFLGLNLLYHNLK